MHYYLADRLFLSVDSALPGPDDDEFLNEIGSGAKVLLIVGSSLALASIAWFVIGLFVN